MFNFSQTSVTPFSTKLFNLICQEATFPVPANSLIKQPDAA